MSEENASFLDLGFMFLLGLGFICMAVFALVLFPFHSVRKWVKSKMI